MNINNLQLSYTNFGIKNLLTKYSEKEMAGILKFTEDIFAVFYIDKKEKYVKSIQIIASAISTKEINLANQISHTTDILKIIKNTIMILSDFDDKTINNLLSELGLFNEKFIAGKEINYNNYLLKISTNNGLLLFTLSIN